jgi:hypothetical protein
MMLGMVNSAPELYLTDFGKAGFSGKNDKNPALGSKRTNKKLDESMGFP